MNIPATSALNGLKSTTLLQDVTAHNVANTNTPDFTAKEGLQTETPSGPTISTIRETGRETDLAESMVQLKQNNRMYSADLKIIKIQDRMLGELVDLVG